MNSNLLTALRSDCMPRLPSSVSALDPTAQLEKVLKSHRRGFSAGNILKLEGEASTATYCVLDGWVALSKSTQDGQRQIIDFVLPGDIINPASANKWTSAMQIEVLSYARIAVVPNVTWANLTEWVPMLRMRESAIISSALSRMSERMLRLGKGTAEMRIAYSLIELYLRLRAIGKVDNDRFHIPLTQQQLGEFAGLSSVHVCRTMRRLSRKNILTVSSQMNITILDLQGLAEIAGVDVAVLNTSIIQTQ